MGLACGVPEHDLRAFLLHVAVLRAAEYLKSDIHKPPTVIVCGQSAGRMVVSGFGWIQHVPIC